MSTGRPPSTTHEQIESVALALFARNGFEQTTVDDIAAAVGVGRRTLFRYFPSKNDIVWGDFRSVRERLHADLEALGEKIGVMDALRRAAVSSNSYPPEQLPGLRIRMTLITTVPALQAHSMLRYAEWRSVVAEYVAARRGVAVDSVEAQTIAHAALGAAMAAFSRWVAHPAEDLDRLLDRGFELLADGFAGAGETP